MLSMRFSPRLAIWTSVALWSLSLVPSALAQYAGAESPPEEIRQGFESIRQEQAKEWLSILASADFAGRGTGQPGYAKYVTVMMTTDHGHYERQAKTSGK